MWHTPVLLRKDAKSRTGTRTTTRALGTRFCGVVVVVSLICRFVRSFEGVPRRFPARELGEFDRHVTREMEERSKRGSEKRAVSAGRGYNEDVSKGSVQEAGPFEQVLCKLARLSAA